VEELDNTDDDDDEDEDSPPPECPPKKKTAPAPTSASRGTRSAPHSIASPNVERALSTLARREETTVSSWRLRCDHDHDGDDEDITEEQQEALARLPAGRWPAKDRDLPLLRRGWLAVADALLEFEALGAKRWLANVRACFTVRRTVISIAHAQCLATVAEAPPGGHTLAAALEVSLLAAPPVASAVPLLARARLLKPVAADLAIASGSFFPTGVLAGFEVKREGKDTTTTSKDKDRERDKEKVKACRQCGARGWTTTHTCTDKDLLAFARAHPRSSRF
jgi:hypothetical protein